MMLRTIMFTASWIVLVGIGTFPPKKSFGVTELMMQLRIADD